MLVLSTPGLPDLDLVDPDGLVCTSLDLGWPETIEATVPMPGRDGVTDQTAHHAARSVALEVDLPGAPAARATALAELARRMQPARRCVLRYADEMGGPGPVREITVAPRAMTAIRTGQRATDVQLQFVAPSGVAVDVAEVTFTLAPVGSSLSGRAYPLAYDRTYPPGQSTGPVTVPILGDTYPQVTARVYGPCTGPSVQITQDGDTWVVVEALAGASVAGGDYLEVDIAARTVLLNGSPGASRFYLVDHATSTWRLPMPGVAAITFAAVSSSPPAQLEITGRGAYFL